MVATPEIITRLAEGLGPVRETVNVLFPAGCRERVLIVGGTVRDALLGCASRDIDLAAALTDAELQRCGFRLVESVSAAAVYFRHHDKFGTLEVTRLGSPAELERDLRRRDFSINAMAVDSSGELIDPLGGQADVAAGILRACSRSSFEDDPLRLFRLIRFCAGGWRIAAETVELIQEREWGGKLASVPVERFSGELLKALALPHPERFFELMLEFGTGATFLPELFAMPAIPAGPPEHHPEGDLFSHSVQVLRRVADDTSDPLARFCAFFHDIGKLATDPALYPKHHGHDEAGFTRAQTFCNRLRLPAAFGKALAWTSRLHGSANRWGELRDATRIRMAQQAVKAGISGILPLVSAADKPGGIQADEWQRALEVAAMNSRRLEIAPERLAALPPEGRAALLLQRRVDVLRNWRGE